MAVLEATDISMAIVVKRPRDPLAHFALGSALICNYCPNRAERFIVAGMLLKAEWGAPGFLWVTAFYLLTGRVDLAVNSSYKTAVARWNDTIAWALHGFSLYMMRRFDEAEHIIKMALGLDPHCWPAQLCNIFLLLATARYEEANKMYQYMNTSRTSGPTVLFPALGAFILFRINGADSAIPGNIYHQVAELAREPKETMDYLQLALFSLLNKPKVAISLLEVALSSRNPLILLLRHWPLFDLLREDPQFQLLLDTIDRERAEIEKYYQDYFDDLTPD
jgi:hypothetical protein